MAAEFYEVSEELETIARELIQDHHSHLVEARIKYLFRTGNWEVKKRETWGQAKKVGKEVNYLTGYDFIITIHRDVWDQLEGKEKRALLDHELQHCSAGSDDAGNKIWYIQGHDVEDFYAIIKRHGLWSKSLRKMDSLLKQTSAGQPQQEQAVELSLFDTPFASGTLATAVREPPVPLDKPAVAPPSIVQETVSIYDAVLPVLLTALQKPSAVADLAKRLDVSKPQLDAWLKKALADKKVRKTGRPVRYVKA